MKKVEIFQKKQEIEKKSGRDAELIKVDGYEYDGRGWYKCSNALFPQEKDVWYWDGKSFKYCMSFREWVNGERIKLLEKHIDMDALFNTFVDSYDNPLMRYKLRTYLQEYSFYKEEYVEEMVNILDGDAYVYRACFEYAIKYWFSECGSGCHVIEHIIANGAEAAPVDFILHKCESYLVEKYINIK